MCKKISFDKCYNFSLSLSYIIFLVNFMMQCTDLLIDKENTFCGIVNYYRMISNFKQSHGLKESCTDNLIFTIDRPQFDVAQFDGNTI